MHMLYSMRAMQLTATAAVKAKTNLTGEATVRLVQDILS
jgi:hypothetical protein